MSKNANIIAGVIELTIRMENDSTFRDSFLRKLISENPMLALSTAGIPVGDAKHYYTPDRSFSVMLNAAQVKKLSDFCVAGRPIEAIKELRTYTTPYMGLKNAKDIVEAYWWKH